jgi:hypothetical protein
MAGHRWGGRGDLNAAIDAGACLVVEVAPPSGELGTMLTPGRLSDLVAPDTAHAHRDCASSRANPSSLRDSMIFLKKCRKRRQILQAPQREPTNAPKPTAPIRDHTLFGRVGLLETPASSSLGDVSRVRIPAASG